MGYGTAIMLISAAVLAAAAIYVARRGVASGPQPLPMSDDPEPKTQKSKAMPDTKDAKVQKIKDIYAQARERLEALRRQRLKIVSDYSAKLDKLRAADARKKLDEL